VSLLHLEPTPVVISEFSNNTIRFAELVVRMVNRKPVAVERAAYSLVRFDANDRPDMDRFRRESNAGLSATADPLLPDPGGDPGNVVDMRSTFTGMGCRWKPTLAEAMLLDQAALGQVKAKVQRLDDETFSLEDDDPAPVRPIPEEPLRTFPPGEPPF
jgi:hypothetical protein